MRNLISAIRFGLRAVLFATCLLATCLSTTRAQFVHREIVVGTRVFGPSPILDDSFACDDHYFAAPLPIGYGYRAYHFGPSYPLGWCGPYYRPYYGYGWYGGWGGWYRPYFRPAPVVLPPIVIPAEEIFGAPAAMRMLGVGLVGARPVVPLRPDLIAAQAEVAAAQPPQAVQPAKPAFVSNAAARARAAKFMELGDAQFAQGHYVAAYERYKSAVQAAPDLVEAYLRRGQALIAMRSYMLATETFKYAFKMHPDWAKTKFRLNVLYGDRQQDKEEHLDALAAAAEKQPTANMMFLVGAQLLYDDQAERAMKFFDRAKEIHEQAGAAQPLPLPLAEKPAAKNNAEAEPAQQPLPAAKKQEENPALF